MNSINSSTSSFKASEHQAAGHDGCMTLNSLFIKPTTRQELDFYTETLKRDGAKEERYPEDEGIALGSLLSHWLPTFLGSLQKGEFSNKQIFKQSLTSSISSSTDNVTAGLKSKEYIVLLNLYHEFKKPSILDIKLGSKLTDDLVTPSEKIARLQKVTESTTSGSHSFRICGMKVYNNEKDLLKPKELFPGMDDTITILYDEPENQLSSASNTSPKYLVYDKYFGRLLDSNTIQQGLELYFKPLKPKIHHLMCLIDNFIHRLQLLYNCLLDHETRMYSASLLFIYECDPQVWSNVSVEEYGKYDPLIKEFELSDDDDDDDDEDEAENVFNDVDAVEREGLHNVTKAYDVIKQIGASDKYNDCDKDMERTAPLSSLHLIDFAHSKYVDGEGYDENVIEGVENLIKLLQNIKLEIE